MHADRTQVQQALLNLVVNARDAMPGGGALTIRTSLTTVEARSTAGPRSRRGRTSVEVADTGQGVDARRGPHLRAVLHHQGVGQGTGLGLSMVYGIANRAAATCRCESTPGRARRFASCCPRRDVRARRQRPSRCRPATRWRDGLLAEDDEGVRDFVGEVFARRVGRRHGGQPDRGAGQRRPSIPGDHLLVTDVVMPGMNGGELADKLVAMRPGLRVLFITGYDDEDVATRA